MEVQCLAALGVLYVCTCALFWLVDSCNVF